MKENAIEKNILAKIGRMSKDTRYYELYSMMLKLHILGVGNDERRRYKVKQRTS